MERQKNITLIVAECGEFPNLGEYHKDIESVDRAIDIFNQIPPERMNGIPSISIHMHEEGTNPLEDIELGIVSGKTIDLEMLEYVPDIANNEKAMNIISELVNKFPEAKVIGSLEKWIQDNPLAKVEELEEGNYNMIDGVINNEKPKKLDEKVSFKDKLTEIKDSKAYKERERSINTHKDLENVL